MLQVLDPSRAKRSKSARDHHRYVVSSFLKPSTPQIKIRLCVGGSIGLGFSIAKKYVLRGAKVTIVARNLEKLKAAQSELESVEGHKVCILSADVSNAEAMKSAVSDSIVFHDQAVYQIVACAGLSLPGYFLDQSLDVFHKEMDVNYFGTLNLIKCALPSMIEHRGAGRRVVIISSACGYIGFIGFSQYCASVRMMVLVSCLKNNVECSYIQYVSVEIRASWTRR